MKRREDSTNMELHMEAFGQTVEILKLRVSYTNSEKEKMVEI